MMLFSSAIVLGYFCSDIDYDLIFNYTSYVADRIDLFGSTNTSTLVYIQGFELIKEFIIKSYGFGIGFQNLGSIIPENSTSQSLYEYTGTYTNINDGGLLLAKLLSEFGVFSLIILLYIYKYIYKSYKVHSILKASKILLFFEFFIRTTGYFSPQLLLILIFICFIRDSKYEC